jgi:uncharacterized membrane protein YhaH (DUF805 family)
MICPFCKACEAALPDGSVQCTHCRAMLHSDRHEMAQVHSAQRMPTTDRPQRPPCLHLLFSHEGRINRAKYWLGNLLLGVIGAVASAMFEWLHPGLSFFATLLMIYPSIMLSIKRAHDLDRSGHFCWLLLIPVVHIFPVILLSFVKGTTGPNRFGPDPLSLSPMASLKVPFSQAV